MTARLATSGTLRFAAGIASALAAIALLLLSVALATAAATNVTVTKTTDAPSMVPVDTTFHYTITGLVNDETAISSGSRPTSSQCRRSTSNLWWIAVGPPKTFAASAYWATRRSVFFSPPPPTMIGGRGRVIDWGELRSRVAR